MLTCVAIKDLKMKKLLTATFYLSILTACDMGPTPQELFSQAQDAASNNENKKAEVLLKQILVEQPSDVQSRLLLAEVYLAQGRYESAIKEFTAYAKLNKSKKPVEGIAKSYFFSQKYEDVIQYLDQFELDSLESELLLL
jgi:predicted Zn-dependent protease